MFEQHSIRNFTVLTIAAAALASLASAAQADVTTNILSRLKAMAGKSGVTPSQVLAAVSNPRPYRQGVMATCDSKIPNLGDNVCIMTFDQIPSSHLLQIDKISCVVPGGAAILFNTQIKVDGAHVFGFALTGVTGSTGASTSGPFYFKVGEKPKLIASGSSPTDTAICSMFGTLWQAN